MLRYSAGMKRMVAFYKPIPITGWSVATVLPETELFAPAIRFMRLMVAITVLVVIFIGIAIILATQRLTSPLRTLAARVHEMTWGNMEGEALEVRSDDEIGTLRSPST